MKKLLLLVMLVLLSVSVCAVGGAMLKASVLRYEPAPAEQGNPVDVWVELNNAGTKADKVAVKFVPEYPFSLPAGSQGFFDVGILSASESKVVKFSVFVDPTAPNGDSDVKFQYKYGSDNWIELLSSVSLETQNAVLVVDSYKVTPSPITPGQTVKVEMQLRNAGRIAVKNVDVSIGLEDGKFSTIGSGAKKRVDYIGFGETETVVFELASDTSTEVKVYNIPVTLSFKDERNKEYTDTAKISLVVNAKPEISLTVDKTVFTSKTVPGTVTLKVVNKGVVNMKYLTVKLIQTPDYDVLSPSNEAYVGNLDSDDFETVDFTVKPLVESPRLSVTLEFKDPYNVDFSTQYDLPLRIITDKELGKTSTPWVSIIIGLLIVAVVIYWWFRRRKKK
ncbi:MAG: hypothetical protein NTW67_05125 [Candidatus Woesearchaeota archaeon]|nr:hypothetical protein [Candidatus Woesearchaeota archaeon]